MIYLSIYLDGSTVGPLYVRVHPLPLHADDLSIYLSIYLVGSTVGPLCVRVHPLALHEDDLPGGHPGLFAHQVTFFDQKKKCNEKYVVNSVNSKCITLKS